MLPEVKRRLIRMYTKMTGAILTVVVIMAFIITVHGNKTSSRELFFKYFDMTLAAIRQESVIKRTTLEELAGSRKILQVWDNGKPLSFPGEAREETENQILLACLKKGKKEKIDLTMPLVTKNELTSEVYELSGGFGKNYFGRIGVVKVKNGFRGLIYIQEYSEGWLETVKFSLWFLLFDGLGIAALYWFNRLFIGRILEPVEVSRRQQAEFIAAVSHELRSPLAVMKANLAAQKDTEQKKSFYKIMQGECDRLNQLVEDLLLLASADAGKWHIEREMVDSEGLLIELYESYESVFKRQNIRLLVEFPANQSLPEFLGDKKRMQQIGAILLSNALRYSPEGSYVLLKGEADREKRILRLMVIDHGRGIPKELREKVFDRFYQADLARGEKEHFGLGLSIARELARIQEGRLFCEETQGGGATFIFSVHF